MFKCRGPGHSKKGLKSVLYHLLARWLEHIAFSKPQFSCLQNRDKAKIHLQRLEGGLNNKIYENSFAPCFTVCVLIECIITVLVELQFSSVQFSCSVVSNSLRPDELQHSRPPCPSPTAEVYSNSCPLSRWSHPTTSSSVFSFSSCLQSFPASFKWVRYLHQVAKVLEFQLQHQSFQWTSRTALF